MSGGAAGADLPCPNCLTPLEAADLDEGPGVLRCPICQYSQRPCPDCGGVMVKQVEAPDDLRIEADGLPLDLCDVQWVCGNEACGRRLDAAL